MRRKILTGLIVLGTLTVSGVLLASSEGDDANCDEKANGFCVTQMDSNCYFYLQGGASRAADRCWYDDHTFAGGGGA